MEEPHRQSCFGGRGRVNALQSAITIAVTIKPRITIEAMFSDKISVEVAMGKGA